jgi:hypothetical protein
LLNATPLSDGAGDAAQVPTQCLFPCISLPPQRENYQSDGAAPPASTAIFFTVPPTRRPESLERRRPI